MATTQRENKFLRQTVASVLRAQVKSLAATHDRGFDCVVPDLRPPDMAEFRRLQKVGAQSVLTGLPVIVFACNNLIGEEHAPFQSMAKSDVLKKVRLPRKRSPRLPVQASKYGSAAFRGCGPAELRRKHEALEVANLPLMHDGTERRRAWALLAMRSINCLTAACASLHKLGTPARSSRKMRTVARTSFWQRLRVTCKVRLRQCAMPRSCFGLNESANKRCGGPPT